MSDCRLCAPQARLSLERNQGGTNSIETILRSKETTVIVCPIVNVSQDRPFILAIDVLLGRDPYAERYIAAYRERSKQA